MNKNAVEPVTTPQSLGFYNRLFLVQTQSTHGVQGSGKRGQTDLLQKGMRIHQYLDDWLVRARSHQTSL